MPQPPHADVRGFLPDDEGLQLYEWALAATATGPLLEIGSYCGRSTIWLGQAAQARQTAVFAIDHHRGSEEHQIGESHHDAELVNAEGLFDTFAAFRRNIAQADLEQVVIPIVTGSAQFAAHWAGPLSVVFIDGGHSLDSALADYRHWAPRIGPGGILAIHDVFPDPADGGQAPHTIWRLAQQSGLFTPEGAVGSLRALRRLAG
ncbi:class I SAM-dependent methyltransferase [Luminiphilus sp.]|nr:class I SAM-dependent methyltransferase [Luminiphilus sp.]MDA9666575.1 class I SAM-dependent methyltransferase [Luminiphilus sp.]